MNKKTEESRHPSFGSIRFSRRYGGNKKFYGSDLTQNSYIGFEILPSTQYREVGSNSHYSIHKPIIEGRMTSVQFAEMITHMNCEGVPCTLEYIQGEKVEDLPDSESNEKFNVRKYSEELDDLLNSYKANVSTALKLLEKKHLNKTDKDELRSIFPRLEQEIKSTLPFYLDEFKKQITKTIVEAKAEVENNLTHQVNTLGLKALNVQNLNTLNNGKGTESRQ